MEWVKITCNILDHRKIKLIRKVSRGDTLVLLWLLLIAEAGKCGRGGALLVSENTPCTAETLSLLLAMPKAIVEQGLALFTQLQMIEWQKDVPCIRNWRKYQSEDKLELRREKERLRQQRHRQKEPGGPPPVSQPVSQPVSHPMSQPMSQPVSQPVSRDVTLENRQEKNRVEKTTTDSVRLLLSQTPLANISDQELGALLQRHGAERMRLAADVAAQTWQRDRAEIRNPGGYLNRLCETLVVPDWYVPQAERQKREQAARERSEMQTAEQAARQAAEEIENKARDRLWQSLSEEERQPFCAAARRECPAGVETSPEVVVILAKLKAWEARQAGGSA
jgi:predicted phage replisome organizer